MANYDAQINILVSGQRNINNLANQLNQIESSITEIENKWRSASDAFQRSEIRLRAAGTRQPRAEGGRFARDPDRQARFRAYADRRRALVEQRLARISLSRTTAEAAASREQIDNNKKLLRQTERRISFESRLNTANERYQYRLQKLRRGGGGRNLSQELQDQARSIQNAYNAAGGAASRNLRLIRSLSIELGVVVERQNEYNRLQALSSKGFEAGRRLQERITDIRNLGVQPKEKIRDLRSKAAQAISASRSGDQQAYSESLRKATVATNRIERESREVAGRIAKFAQRSPVLGGVNFPGSPKALEAQRRAEEAALSAAQKGYPASPIAGTSTMVGSPRFLAAQERSKAAADKALKAQERAAVVAEKAANREAAKILKESQKGYPASPIFGTATMAGSPRFLANQERNRLAAERRAKAQQVAEERAARIQQQVARAAERAADKALREAQKGYPSSPILGTASIQGSPRWVRARDVAEKRLQKAAAAAERAASKALRDAQRGFPSSPILGTPTMPGSPRFLAAQEKARSAAERAFKAQEKAAALAEKAANREAAKILKESQKGYPSSPLLGTATMVGSPRFLANQEAKRLAAERRARTQRIAEERAARIQERAARAAEREADKALRDAQRGYPSSPILGTSTMVGSPRYLAAQERARAAAERASRARAAGGGEALSIDSPRRLRRTLASGAIAEQSLINLQNKGVDVTEQLISLQKTLNDAKRDDFQISQRTLGNLEEQVTLAGKRVTLENRRLAGKGGSGDDSRQIEDLQEALRNRRFGSIARATNEQLEELARRLQDVRNRADATGDEFRRLGRDLAVIGREQERRDPGAEFLTRRVGSRTGRAISEGLVGGAFPLLFGQGIGSAVLGGAGGALGGFAGGGLGFGLSLAGTALGSAFDGAIQGAQDLGAALRSPVESFQLLSDRSLFSSKAIEQQAQALIDVGRVAEASALIQEDLNRRLGPATVNGLKDLSSAGDELARATAGSTAQLQLFIANMVGLGPILRGLASGARINELQARAGNVIAELRQEGKTAEAAQLEEVFGRTRFTQITPEQYASQLNAALEEAEKSLKPVEVKLNDFELKKQLETEIASADRVRALRQQGIDLERNAQNLRENIEESILAFRKRGADLERESVEFRRSIEDQIFNKRQNLERRLIDNDRIRQQNAINSLDLQLQKAGVGLDPIAQSIVAAARQYLKTRAEGEAELQQNEKELRLELQGIDQETSRYKLQTEDRVAQIALKRDEFTKDVAKTRLDIERSIGDYVVRIEEYRLAMARHRYEMEIDLEKKKQIAAQAGLTGGGGPVDRLMGTAAEREKFVQGQLVRREFTPEQMAAVMGSIRQESTFNPYAQEPGGTGLGLFQLSFGRRNKVPAFTGNWQQDIVNQLDLFQEELNSTEAKAGQMLMGATTLQGAAAGMKQFERYGIAGRRYDYMQDYYKKFTGGAGVPVSQQLEPGFTEKFDLNRSAPIAPNAPQVPELPSAPQLPGVIDLLEKYLTLQRQIKSAAESGNQVLAERLEIDSELARVAFEQQAISPILQFQEQNRELEFEIQKRKERNRLLMEGVRPEIVEGELRVLDIQRTLNSQLEGLRVSANEYIKTQLKRLGINDELVSSTFELNEATLASLLATVEDTERQKELQETLQNILDIKNKLKTGADTAAQGARNIAAMQAPTLAEGISAEINQLEKDLDPITVATNSIVNGANAIGTAFGQAFTDVASGAKSTEEALADTFESIGKAFLGMAAEIIAKQLTMIALQTTLKVLGAISGGGGAPDAGDAMGGSGSLPLIANPGESVSMNAAGGLVIPGLANGGPVNANQPYIVGERGPELFIPFQHGNITSNEELKAQMREASSAPMAFAKPGADGKNGDDTITTSETRESKEARETREVMLPFQQGDNTTSNNRTTDRSYADRLRETREERSYADRLRETREERSYAELMRETREVMLPFTRSAEQASMVAAERETAQAISNPGSIDVRYESTVVNGVEYVTAEQHRQGMAQAAERGRTLTLQALQNSVKSRRKVGLA